MSPSAVNDRSADGLDGSNCIVIDEYLGCLVPDPILVQGRSAGWASAGGKRAGTCGSASHRRIHRPRPGNSRRAAQADERMAQNQPWCERCAAPHPDGGAGQMALLEAIGPEAAVGIADHGQELIGIRRESLIRMVAHSHHLGGDAPAVDDRLFEGGRIS
jgi:hypothetical protein